MGSLQTTINRYNSTTSKGGVFTLKEQSPHLLFSNTLISSLLNLTNGKLWNNLLKSNRI